MDSRLRIGITCYPTFGGSGVVATELGIALAERGHEVHFIASRLPARLQSHGMPDVSFHEVNVYNYSLFRHEPYTLALAAKMAEVTDAFGLEVLHVHYAIPHAVSAHLAQEMLEGRIQVVTTLHGTDITLVGNDPSLHRITRFAINKSDAVTAVSQWLKDETIREFSPSVPVNVIRNFVDTSQFRPDLNVGIRWSGRRHCQGDLKRLIHVSNFRPVKRAPEVIEIFKRVRDEQPCELLMVGDGPDLGTAVSRARELGISDCVQFLGNREDVALLLAASDILVLPSGSESFGLSALEAMASGCAVVCSNIGGLPEVVTDGVEGYLRPMGDVEGMAACCIELLANEPRLDDMKRAARERAERDFTVGAVVPEYLSLYENVLGRSLPAGSLQAGVR